MTKQYIKVYCFLKNAVLTCYELSLVSRLGRSFHTLKKNVSCHSTSDMTSNNRQGPASSLAHTPPSI